MLTLQNSWFYTVMAVRLKNVVFIEVNEAFLAMKMVRGRLCCYITNTDAIKYMLLLIFDISKTLITTKAPSAYYYFVEITTFLCVGVFFVLFWGFLQEI